MATALAEAKGNWISPGLTRDGWGNRFAMDARAHIESRLPSRKLAASDCSPHAALHAPGITHQRSMALDRYAGDIFKKTPCAADSKPAGRYVAKEAFNIDRIPLPNITLLDAGQLQGDCSIVAGRPISDTLKSDAGILDVKLTDAELTKRKTKSKARETNPISDVLWTVGPGVDGAVAHPGAAYEKQCYADI